MLPGVHDGIGDFVAAKVTQRADGLGVELLDAGCTLPRSLSPDGGEDVRLARLRSSLSPRRGEGRGEGCGQQFQQLVLGRPVLRFTRGLDSFEAIFNAR